MIEGKKHVCEVQFFFAFLSLIHRDKLLGPSIQFASFFCFALLSLVQRDKLLGPQVGEKEIRERRSVAEACHTCV